VQHRDKPDREYWQKRRSGSLGSWGQVSDAMEYANEVGRHDFQVMNPFVHGDILLKVKL